MTTSPAKITKPAHTGIMERIRLFNLLEAGRKRPITWVNGPAGSGKTTLVSSYIDSFGLKSLWYKMDAIDEDMATFFYYLGLAAQKATPRKRTPMPLLTPEYLMGVPAFTRSFFEELGNRLGAGFTIVFDNYHKVPLDSPFHETLREGLAAVPEGISVVVISRGAPPKTFSRLRANGDLQLIGWDDLRLSAGETCEMALLRGCSQEAVSTLFKKTKGWAAGLVLLLEEGHFDDAEFHSLADSPPEEVFDYFASELFDKLQPTTREVLLKTSFLPQMTSAMAQQISENQGADLILRDLNRQNFFTEKSSKGQPVFQYHPLFREFLLHRAEEEYKDSELQSLGQKASALLEDAGYFEDAAQLFGRSGNWQGLVKLIMNQSKTLLRQGRSNVLEQWLKSLPEQVFANMPWMHYWLGVCRLPYAPRESGKHFRKAFAGFELQQDIAGLFLSCAGSMEAVIFDQEDFKKLDPLIALMDELVQRFGDVPAGEIEMRVASSMFSAMVSRKPGHPEFNRWQERALTLTAQGPDINLQAHTILQQVLSLHFRGDLAKTSIIIEDLRSLARTKAISPFGLIILNLAETHLHNAHCRHDKCLDTVQKGLDLANKTGVHVFSYLLMGHAVWSSLNVADEENADKFFKLLSAQPVVLKPWPLCLLHYLRGMEALQKENLVLALEHAERSLHLAENVGAFMSQYLCNLLTAQVEIELGNQHKATRYIRKAREAHPETEAPLRDFMCCLTEALASFSAGKDQQAIAVLQQALKIGKIQGYENTPLWRPSVMTRLCEKALEEGIEVEYVQSLIRKRGLIPESPPLHIERWPWQVRIYTMGRFGVLVNNKPLAFSGKGKKKPMELLQVLVALGGREVNVDRISAILWPDALGDAAQKAFKTTLHRLRKLFSEQETFTVVGGRISLNSRYCWVDSWALGRLFFQADQAAVTHKGQGEAYSRTVNRIFALYKGSFLRETAEGWASVRRETLQSKFRRHILRYAVNLEAKQAWQEAEETYRRALEIDNFAESFRQGLIRTLHEQRKFCQSEDMI